MAKYHKEAEKISELWNSLENISYDDGKAIEDYSQKEIVAEAEYVLSTFFEGRHANNDDLNSDDPNCYLPAQEEVRELRRFIKKYK